MTGAFHHIAVASLPVAIGLLVLTAVARVLQNDERRGRVARAYLGPLSAWCLIFVAVHAVALGLAGELGAGSVGVALVIGAAAVLLRAEAEPEDEPDDAPERAVAAREPAAPARPAAPRSLWAEPDGDSAPRTGLWT